MSLIVPDVGKIRLEKFITGEVAPAGFRTKLFQNNFTPGPATVIGSFTEATFSGYALANLSNPVTAAALDAQGRAFTLWDLVTWTKNGATGNTIYGYWVEDGASNLLWCERFDSGAFAMNTDGTVLQFYPRLTYKSQFSNT